MDAYLPVLIQKVCDHGLCYLLSFGVSPPLLSYRIIMLGDRQVCVISLSRT